MLKDTTTRSTLEQLMQTTTEQHMNTVKKDEIGQRLSAAQREELQKFTQHGRHICGEYYGRSRSEISKHTLSALLRRKLIEGRRIAGGGQYYITEKGLRAIGINGPQRVLAAAL